jgi:protein-disulfide isomerase-like protein with CxxC motif
MSGTSGQPHVELVAFVKLVTEFFMLDAFWAAVAIVAAEGLERRAAIELFSAVTDELMALVWLGKSLLAELTSAVAAVSTF